VRRGIYNMRKGFGIAISVILRRKTMSFDAMNVLNYSLGIGKKTLGSTAMSKMIEVDPVGLMRMVNGKT